MQEDEEMEREKEFRLNEMSLQQSNSDRILYLFGGGFNPLQYWDAF